MLRFSVSLLILYFGYLILDVVFLLFCFDVVVVFNLVVDVGLENCDVLAPTPGP